MEDSKEKQVVGSKRSTRGYHPKYEEKVEESLSIATRKRRKTDTKEKSTTISEKPSSENVQNSNFAALAGQAHNSDHIQEL